MPARANLFFMIFPPPGDVNANSASPHPQDATVKTIFIALSNRDADLCPEGQYRAIPLTDRACPASVPQTADRQNVSAGLMSHSIHLPPTRSDAVGDT